MSELEPSDEARMIEEQLLRFMEDRIYPAERVAHEQLEGADDPHADPPVLVELRERAREAGLWNLFLPDPVWGAGLSNLDYVPLAEIMGRSPLAPRAFNCQAPDTGNAEILVEYGTEEQKARWLAPLLAGDIRSCFSMTEPEVAGSDPTKIRTRAVRDGDAYVIEGSKWFTSGAMGAAFAIVMAVTDPDAEIHERASMIVVPTDTEGFEVVRAVPVMGHVGGGGHCEIRYDRCRVPVSNRLGEEGSGFVLAQARLGPGRIHHCMRAVGMAERAFEIMCRHANHREVMGGLLRDQQFVQDWIARSRMEIDQARLLTLHAARTMDAHGNRRARQAISMIKVVVPTMLMNVLDRAVQCLGALGMTDETPVALFWRLGRALRIADGPDEVHKMVIARRELARFP